MTSRHAQFLLVCTILSLTVPTRAAIAEVAHSKPLLTLDAVFNWPSLRRADITADGRYALYTVVTPTEALPTTVITEVGGGWRHELRGVSNAAFSLDSKSVFWTQDDGLRQLRLGGSDYVFQPRVRAYRQVMAGDQLWMARAFEGAEKHVVLDEVGGNSHFELRDVESYWLFGGERPSLVALIRAQTNSDAELLWIELYSGQKRVVWKGGSKISRVIVDDSGRRLAFAVAHSDGTQAVGYVASDGQPTMLSSPWPGIRTARPRQFMGRDDALYIDFEQIPSPKSPSEAPVEVVTYLDPKVAIKQVRAHTAANEFLLGAVLGLDGTRRTILLQKPGETLVLDGANLSRYLLVTSTQAKEREFFLPPAVDQGFAVTDSRSGERQSIPSSLVSNVSISPGGKYVVGLNAARSDLLAYNLHTRQVHNLTNHLPIPSYERDVTWEPRDPPRTLLIAGWSKDEMLYLYDRYDVWKLNPDGSSAPISVTHQYGRRHSIIFRNRVPNTPISDEPDVLSGFDTNTMSDGFYRTKRNADPVRLSGGAYVHDLNLGDVRNYVEITPKAKDAPVSLVLRESPGESTNLYSTTDFVRFRRLSDIAPERAYNWVKPELHSFRATDGRILNGILYKPEDFDSSRKYPVIINYYEKRSDELNQYRWPDQTWNGGEIPIPWFVSHGYLVFVPDIYDTLGNPGEDAFRAVVGSKRYLENFAYVDGKKIGLQGHSFGGFYTNYLVTRTNEFAAAMTSNGPSSIIGEYGEVWGSGAPKQSFVEREHYRFGGNLWELQDAYIRNSPIFYADRVQTPILIVANPGDSNVRPYQGLQWFLALRRLGKRAWLLRYANSGHGVDGPVDARDYLTRLTQFFDHFLKGAPPPAWMTRSSPSNAAGGQSEVKLDRPH